MRLGTVVGGLGLVLLGVDSPEDIHTEEAVRAEGQLNHQTQSDPVGAEAEDFVLLAGQHGIEEDAAEGDLGSSFVAEGVVDDQPDTAAGNEGSEKFDQENATEFVPVPGGFAEEPKRLGVVLVGRTSRSFPDTTDRTTSQADDPGRHHRTKRGEDLRAKARSEKGYQGVEAGSKLIHERAILAGGQACGRLNQHLIRTPDMARFSYLGTPS